jgi:hypothetical protein
MQQCCGGGGSGTGDSFNFAISGGASTSCYCANAMSGAGFSSGPGGPVGDDNGVLACFQSCRDYDALLAGCDTLTADTLTAVECRPQADAGFGGGTTCSAGEFCCTGPGLMNLPSNTWSCTSQGFSQDNNGCGGGFAIRCTGDRDCKPGFVCCYDAPQNTNLRDVMSCKKSCPDADRVCRSSSDCPDGGACALGPKCIAGKCGGSAPSGCAN